MTHNIDQTAERVRTAIAELGELLELDFGSADETRSPCPNSDSADDEQIDFHAAVDPDRPLGREAIDTAADYLERAGWSVEREENLRGDYLFAWRGTEYLELGIVLERKRLTLAASSGCHRQ